jgi:hypothetical protein
MIIFKTTKQILDAPWNTGVEAEEYPFKHEWLLDRRPMFEDVKIWEQIYFQPGNIGIYAAWSPYVEVYAIYYGALGYLEKITGLDAGKKVYDIATNIGITLPINRVWVPPDDPLLRPLQLTPL